MLGSMLLLYFVLQISNISMFVWLKQTFILLQYTKHWFLWNSQKFDSCQSTIFKDGRFSDCYFLTAPGWTTINCIRFCFLRFRLFNKIFVFFYAYPLANFIKLSVEQNYRITKQQHHFSNGFLTTEKTSFLFLMVPNVT